MTDGAAAIRKGVDVASAEKAVRLVATIAALSILLGFVIQTIIVAVKVAGGAAFPGLQMLVDVTQGVTWSFLVCLGVGIGATLSKARPAALGLIGFASAPVGIAAAKAAQNGMGALIGGAGQAAVLSLAVVASLRAVEYGVLAWILGTLVRRETAAAASYVGAGAGTGVVFGTAIAVLTFTTAAEKGITLALPQVLATVVNEIGFPIGCSLVIYVSQLIGRNMKVIAAGS